VLVTETTLFGAALTASIDSLDVFMQKLESWPRLYVLSARVADSVWGVQFLSCVILSAEVFLGLSFLVPLGSCTFVLGLGPALC